MEEAPESERKPDLRALGTAAYPALTDAGPTAMPASASAPSDWPDGPASAKAQIEREISGCPLELLSTCCVTLGESLTLSEPHSPRVK